MSHTCLFRCSASLPCAPLYLPQIQKFIFQAMKIFQSSHSNLNITTSLIFSQIQAPTCSRRASRGYFSSVPKANALPDKQPGVSLLPTLLQHQFLLSPHQTFWPLPKLLVCSSCHLELNVLIPSSWLFISFQIQVQTILYSLPCELSLFLPPPPPAVPALESVKSPVCMNIVLKQNAALAFSKQHKENRKQMKTSHYIKKNPTNKLE